MSKNLLTRVLTKFWVFAADSVGQTFVAPDGQVFRLRNKGAVRLHLGGVCVASILLSLSMAYARVEPLALLWVAPMYFGVIVWASLTFMVFPKIEEVPFDGLSLGGSAAHGSAGVLDEARNYETPPRLTLIAGLLAMAPRSAILAAALVGFITFGYWGRLGPLDVFLITLAVGGAMLALTVCMFVLPGVRAHHELIAEDDALYAEAFAHARKTLGLAKMLETSWFGSYLRARRRRDAGPR